MKNISALALACLALVLVSCGKSSVPEESGPAGAKPGAGKATAAEPAARPADFLRLSAVRLSPANPSAATDLSAEADVTPPVPDEFELQYRWVVDGQEVEDVPGATLACSHFRKKQWVFCEVRATAGEKTSDWLPSKRVRIANSPPLLQAPAAENFTVPGQFTLRITASDPDQDELAFELLSPLDQGIALDAKTGVLAWKLDEETVKRLGESIEISFAVSDGDGGKTSGTVTLNLTKPK